MADTASASRAGATAAARTRAILQELLSAEGDATNSHQRVSLSRRLPVNTRDLTHVPPLSARTRLSLRRCATSWH